MFLFSKKIANFAYSNYYKFLKSINMNNDDKKNCIACGITEEEVPLIVLTYKGEEMRICPQHIPLLIHEPQKLVGKFEGAENMTPG